MSYGAKTNKRIFPDAILGKVLGKEKLEMYGVASQLFEYADKHKLRDGKILGMNDDMREIWKNSGVKSSPPKKIETFAFIKVLWAYIKKHRLFREP